jgi:hypothetical protein
VTIAGVKILFKPFFDEAGVITMRTYFRDHVGNVVAGFTQRQQVIQSTIEGET